MKIWIKSICFVFVVAVVMAFANQKKAEAIQLPVLDFGSLAFWDGTTLTDTNSASTSVNTVIYKDLSFTSLNSQDAVIDSLVHFNISFDGDNTNDTFGIAGFFNFGLVDVNNSVDVTSGFSIGIDSGTLLSPSGRWWDEFLASLPATAPFAQITFAPMTSFGGNLYNSTGKLAPVPEPGTIALLGIGLAGLVGVGVRRRMKMKKNVD